MIGVNKCAIGAIVLTFEKNSKGEIDVVRIEMKPSDRRSMSEVEMTLRRIEENKSVIGTLVLNGSNCIIHSRFKGNEATKYAEKLPILVERARCMVRDMDPTNDLTFLRVHANNTEILVSPGDDYMLAVVQNTVPIEN
jgi:dynein light chain roadblock-type